MARDRGLIPSSVDSAVSAGTDSAVVIVDPETRRGSRARLSGLFQVLRGAPTKSLLGIASCFFVSMVFWPTPVFRHSDSIHHLDLWLLGLLDTSRGAHPVDFPRSECWVGNVRVGSSFWSSDGGNSVDFGSNGIVPVALSPSLSSPIPSSLFSLSMRELMAL